MPLQVWEQGVCTGWLPSEAHHPTAVLPNLQNIAEQGMEGDLPLPVLRLGIGDDDLSLVAIDGLIHVYIRNLHIEHEIIETQGCDLIGAQTGQHADEVDRPPVLIDLRTGEELLHVCFLNEDHLVPGQCLRVGQFFDHAVVRERVRHKPRNPSLRDGVIDEAFEAEEDVPHGKRRKRFVRIGLCAFLLRGDRTRDEVARPLASARYVEAKNRLVAKHVDDRLEVRLVAANG